MVTRQIPKEAREATPVPRVEPPRYPPAPKPWNSREHYPDLPDQLRTNFIVTRYLQPKPPAPPEPPTMGILITDACSQCNRTSHWPEEVFARTGRVCACCLARQPERVFALVMGEAHPYRSAPLTPPAMRWGLRRPHRIVNAVWPWVTQLVVWAVASTGHYVLALAVIPVLLALAYLRRVPR